MRAPLDARAGTCRLRRRAVGDVMCWFGFDFHLKSGRSLWPEAVPGALRGVRGASDQISSTASLQRLIPLGGFPLWSPRFL
jgi:hypothetical protein